ncbi:MAG: uracil-xanthine permease [Defluviitaleaceae bacterium]|nr:uracil-xanthine permease [Defluviitaleaceae bacterium]
MNNLSKPKLSLLGLQHMFAMFGATILVPLLSGLSVQTTLISVGVGTLIFHLLAKGRVPAFLGSSFAFLVGIQLITDPETGLFAGSGMPMEYKLAYATGGIMVSGLVYIAFAVIIKLIGAKKFMEFVPPVVTAPTVILIGIMLAPFAISQSSNNIFLATLTLFIVIVAASWGKGMIKIIPILLGIGGAYAIALIMHSMGMTNPNGTPILDFSSIYGASLAGVAPFMLPRFNIIAILVMIPFAIATIAEHIGDMVALSTITGKDLIKDPGLSRTLLGDGLASGFSGLIGGPASTTYGENVGVVALTKITNPRVVQIAAVYATVLGFSPIFAAVIYSVPAAIIGGASFMLYGMIAAVGIRNLVDAKVDVSKTKNLTIIAIMLVMGLGLRFGPRITFMLGATEVPIDRLGIAIAVVVGVILNIILPDKEAQ